MNTLPPKLEKVMNNIFQIWPQSRSNLEVKVKEWYKLKDSSQGSYMSNEYSTHNNLE